MPQYEPHREALLDPRLQPEDVTDARWIRRTYPTGTAVTGVISVVVVLLALVGILFFIVRGARGDRPAARSLRDLSGYSSPSGVGGVVAGLVAALAASGLVALTAAPAAAAVTAGVLVGVLFAVLSGFSLRSALSITMAVFGILGLASGVVGFVTHSSCSTVDAGSRIIISVVLGLAAIGGIVLRVLAGRFHPQSILAVFGAFRVVTFLSSPFGLSLLQLPRIAFVVALVSALLFGLIAGVAPDLVIGLCALAVSFASIAVTSTIGTACTVGARPDDLLVVIGFGAGYAIVRFVVTAVAERS